MGNFDIALPGDYLGAPDPDMPLSGGGEYPPRVLFSHGRREGVTANAWNKFGPLSHGDILIQVGEGDDWFLAEPEDNWYLLTKPFLTFSGVRDPWTHELLEADLDLKEARRGGSMYLQVVAGLVWIPKERDGVPPGLCVSGSFQKATAAPFQRWVRTISRTDEPADVPQAFRVTANLIGSSKQSRPNDKGQTFHYTTLNARFKRTSEAQAERLAAFLKDESSRENFEQIVDYLEGEISEIKSVATGSGSQGVEFSA